jgi:formyl-CoA transferase
MSQDNKNLLNGIKVVELTTMVFGPAAGVVLSDFGADVVKIEPPITGDLNRNWHKITGLPISEMPYAFQMTNRNKKSVVLDLKSEEAHEALCKLVKDADILITNYRLDAISRLKIDYKTMKNINPKLIYALATGYGERAKRKISLVTTRFATGLAQPLKNTYFPTKDGFTTFPLDQVIIQVE